MCAFPRFHRTVLTAVGRGVWGERLLPPRSNSNSHRATIRSAIGNSTAHNYLDRSDVSGCMESVALDASLNRRQLDVLTWIKDGCPDGRWADHTFKTTAQALASRRLVGLQARGNVEGRDLPAGEHYWSTGRPSPGHLESPTDFARNLTGRQRIGSRQADHRCPPPSPSTGPENVTAGRWIDAHAKTPQGHR